MTSNAAARATEAEARAAARAEAERRERMNSPAARSPLLPVMQNYFRTANAGRYATLRSMYTPESVRFLEGEEGTLGGIRGQADQLTRNRTFVRAEFGREEIRGETGTLTYVAFYKDGSSETLTADFVKSGRRWLITVR